MSHLRRQLLPQRFSPKAEGFVLFSVKIQSYLNGMTNETCSLRKGNPVAAGAVLLDEVLEGFIFVGRPRASLDARLIAARSSPHYRRRRNVEEERRRKDRETTLPRANYPVRLLKKSGWVPAREQSLDPVPRHSSPDSRRQRFLSSAIISFLDISLPLSLAL